MSLEVVRVPNDTNEEELIALVLPAAEPAVVPYYSYFRRRILLAGCHEDDSGAFAYDRAALWKEKSSPDMLRYRLLDYMPDYKLLAGDVVELPYRDHRFGQIAGGIVLRHLRPNPDPM